MATMKAFTDLEQSKKLAEILPLESADMTYCAVTKGMREKMIIKNWEINVGLNIAIKENLFSYRNGYMIPCWSLAAMLDALPSNLQLALAINDYQGDIKERYAIGSVNSDIYDCYADNPIDACYEMIIKLHELKLL